MRHGLHHAAAALLQAGQVVREGRLLITVVDVVGCDVKGGVPRAAAAAARGGRRRLLIPRAVAAGVGSGGRRHE